uniref:malate dehydrogenase n=1 Tax=Trypanosoma congolense (strain IL3000) TaxID=1068625 RepID=G0UVP3_TRYCI|nr:unnamed protein product [Trypanosoma congolense IL3000]
MVSFFRKVSKTLVDGKVVVFGATSPVGRHLSLLLALCPHVRRLCCVGPLSRATPTVDVPQASSALADLLHIDTNTSIGLVDNMEHCKAEAHRADLVLFCSCGIPSPSRKLRNKALVESAPELLLALDVVAQECPRAVVGIVSGPVNSLVPLAREVLLQRKIFDPRKLFGVTTPDVMHTRVLLAKEMHMNPYDLNVPVVGGRGGATICPLVTQTGFPVPHERIVQICEEVQSEKGCVAENVCDNLGKETVTCMDDNAQPKLSIACAALEWSISILKAQHGNRGITECCFVESSVVKETPFFSSRVELGVEGVERLLPLGDLTPYEEELVAKAAPLIADDVTAGLRFAPGSDGTVL